MGVYVPYTYTYSQFYSALLIPVFALLNKFYSYTFTSTYNINKYICTYVMYVYTLRIILVHNYYIHTYICAYVQYMLRDFNF